MNNKKKNNIVQSMLVALGGAIVSLPLAAGATEKAVDETNTVSKQRENALARAAAAGLPLQVTLPDGSYAALQRFIGTRPIYYITDNANAADTVSTDEVHSGGSAGLALDGTGQRLGIWDGGSVRNTHQELSGRVTNLDTASFSNHSTHVAGTMIAAGVSTAARGMAFNAELHSRDFNDDLTEMIAVQAGATPVIVSNHSYGFITGWRFNFFGDGLWAWFGDVDISTSEDSLFGFYGDTAQDWDQLSRDVPDYLIVKSAGNDRNDAGPGSGTHWHFDGAVGDFVLGVDTHPADGGASGYDTIGGGPGSAKNILTVGAVSDINGGYSAPGDVVMSSFSGWGPTDDGRIKPDLVANGVSLFSSGSASDTTYTNASGTSMSTPNVSGSMGLLQQHAINLYGNPLRSATMRALAIHTADEAGNTGPDYTFGWGLLNTASAALVMSNDALGLPTDELHELTLLNSTTASLFFDADAAGTVRVTVAWTDPAGTPVTVSVDPTDLMLVNDLDIRLTDPQSNIHLPWVLDPASPATAATLGDNFRDPVEQIVVSPSVQGTYRLDITHKGTLQNSSPQAFSVVISTPCCTNDTDGDSIPDSTDNCPAVANLDQKNTDNDSHGDVCDNCTLVDNEDQYNTNPPDGDSGDRGDDNIGNACDADLDNNGIVNSFDLSIMRAEFGATGTNDADLDSNGVVNSFDLTVMRNAFGGTPGPSGL